MTFEKILDKIIETECIKMERTTQKTTRRLEKESSRNQKIIDTAFQIFVERKIEPVSMGEIAEAAGIGRATLFRCHKSDLRYYLHLSALMCVSYHLYQSKMLNLDADYFPRITEL